MMATKSKPFDATAALTECEGIVVQLKAAAERDKGQAKVGKVVSTFGDYLVTHKEEILTLGEYTEDQWSNLSTELFALGAKIAPEAQVTWSKEQLNETLEKLHAMEVLGLLSDEDADRAVKVTEELTSLRKGGGTGTRGERKEQPVIEGRPYERVRIEKIDDHAKVAEQAGNKANSGPNLKTAVVKYLTNNSVTVTDEMGNEIAAAIKSVIEDGKPEATIMDALRIFPVTAEAEATA